MDAAIYLNSGVFNFEDRVTFSFGDISEPKELNLNFVRSGIKIAENPGYVAATLIGGRTSHVPKTTGSTSGFENHVSKIICYLRGT